VESTTNALYDQLETTEHLIVRYIEGDREQPLLPPAKAEPEARPQLGFFGKAKAAMGGRRKKAAATAEA
jgi:hypothetical protein